MTNEEILTYYYKNRAYKLRKLCDQVLAKLGKFPDPSEYYSIADEVFADVIKRYDGEREFRGLLYASLLKKFKTEITRGNRQKRFADKNSISIHNTMPGTEVTYESALPDKRDFVHDYMHKDDDELKEIRDYLSRLSKKQRKVAILFAEGYEEWRVIELAGITRREFLECMQALTATRNIQYLNR